MDPSLAPAAGEGHWTDVNQDAIVLGLLLECQDDFVSGTVLCDKLDVPRAELLKRIDSLRARGYQIQASGGGRVPAGGGSRYAPRGRGPAGSATRSSAWDSTSRWRCTISRKSCARPPPLCWWKVEKNQQDQ